MALAGKTALVTGGGRGIGRGIAEALLDAGARVTVASRTEADLDETVHELSSHGEITGKTCDVSDVASVSELVDHVLERHNTIDILVCSHGVLNAGHSILDFPVDLWEETIAINLTGVFLCSQAAARAMVDQSRGGRIINISSTAALASVPHEAAYDASKGGVQALTRTMALDLAPYAITVNAIAPAWVRSPMVPAQYLTEEYARVCNPMGRLGEPADVGGAVLWLADPATSYVTGTTIVVDGGQYAALGNFSVATEAN
jgi:NAD(P)-dependent dehydrogenase (short-subunit alcohol dehydrogenase family)